MQNPFWLACVVLSMLSGNVSAQTGYAEAGKARPHEQLDGALWMQSSAEFSALARQTFSCATEKLSLALRDPQWTASLEQFAAGGYRKLPPAVIVNLDETVLNNSPYQSRIILEYGQHDLSRFIAWCNEAKCPAVSGAKEFLQHVTKAGVAIIYISPRPKSTREGTLQNLQRLDYPYDANKDQLLLGGGWPNHDKREQVASDHRILLILSDHLGDFLHDTAQGATVRREMADRYAEYWGFKWFLLPNPMYGHWEYSFQNYNYGLDRPSRIENKLRALDTKQERSDRTVR